MSFITFAEELIRKQTVLSFENSIDRNMNYIFIHLTTETEIVNIVKELKKKTVRVMMKFPQH